MDTLEDGEAIKVSNENIDGKKVMQKEGFQNVSFVGADVKS